MPVLAIGGVEVAVWVVALAAILILAASWVFFRIIEAVLGHVPLVGGYIGHTISSWLGRAIHDALSWADDATRAVGHWLWVAGAGMWHVVYKVVDTIAHAMSVAVTSLHVGAAALPQAKTYTNGVASTLTRWIHDTANLAGILAAAAEAKAIAYANAAVASVERDVNYVAHLASQWALDAERAAVNFATTEANALSGRLDTLTHALASGLAGAAATSAADLASAVATAEAAATAAERAAVAAASTIAAGASAGAVAALDHAAHDLVLGPWAALLPSLGALADTLPASTAAGLGLPGVLTEPLPISIPGILSMVVPAVGALTTEVERCVIPQCDNLGGLTKLFGELKDVALLGLMLAFFVECVADPTAAADEIEAVLGPFARAAAAGLRDLIGV